MTVIQDFERYLKEILNVTVKAIAWEKEQDLPPFLRAPYCFYRISLLGSSCLVMLLKAGEEITPAIISKHIKQVEAKWGGLCIYVCEAISSYNRKRLIEHGIPFIVPGNQCYLPDLGIDLREHFRTLRSQGKLFLSPATQAVLIHALRHRERKKWIPSELAKELHYTAMTMTRAFDELESMNIGEISQKGRERWLRFPGDKEELWKYVKPLMLSPVKKRVWLRLRKGKKFKWLGSISGLSALAQSSMLNDPIHPVYAVDRETWKTMRQTGIFEELPSSEEADVELELWSYDPELFAQNGLVDPFSLYLTLQESKDERIEAALEKFMRKIQW
ncbi:MAG: hypothetical protein KGZ39_03955 [Simkania sp.]|nr:hypothetical protein [Simkania sp.]